MKRLIVLMVALSLIAFGYATTQDGKRTQTEGTLVGAGSGALLGALIGGLAGGKDGALLGAAIALVQGLVVRRDMPMELTWQIKNRSMPPPKIG
jgi:hypothetical protein